MHGFLIGIATCSCWGITAFFLKFWVETRDRFFLLFAAAFAVLSINWLLLGLWQPTGETRPFFYLLRLLAFGLIIAAVWEKNRPAAD
ncbi:MAG TPA: DUF5985 family protein [Vicinamibacterales bacterium]|nr:DUF5985 family protein [Vicinamibacterales bacterium]